MVLPYKIATRGQPVGLGVTQSFFVTNAAIAKAATPAAPWIVINEVFCAAIAHALLLPCPPCAIGLYEGEQIFTSLSFNLLGGSLPPADVERLACENPRLAWGIILFDGLVMNEDRHHMNLSFDTTSGRVDIFDHSHAFLSPAGDISTRLAAKEHDLGIGGHCLAQHIREEDGLQLWLDRISRVPDFYIDGKVKELVALGLPELERSGLADFMRRRRLALPGLVKAHHFPHLPYVTP